MTRGPTFAAAAERLRENGYAPIAHRREFVAVRCASLTAPPLAALTVCAGLAVDVLTARGLTAGPVRIGADAARTWPVRLVNAVAAENPWRAGGVEIAHMVGGRSAVISLGGAWPRGTLLDVPCAQLPALDRRRIAELLAAVAFAPSRRRA